MGYLILSILLAILFLCCFALSREKFNMETVFSPRMTGMAVVAGVFVLNTLLNTFIVVEAGSVKVAKMFGEMQESGYTEGLHVINPILTIAEMNVRRQSLDFTGKDTAEGLSKGKVQMLVDVTTPFILNPGSAWKVYQRYGPNGWNLIRPSARDAIRYCTSKLTWEYSASEEGRKILAECISKRQSELVISDLLAAGFSDMDAQQAFTFPTAQLRKVVPVKERILAAISEEQAAQIDLRRQQTLTAIAKEEANRRKNEGVGIKKMMNELPENFTVMEMVAIINANAAKANAEAFTKAVENSNPNITVITGGRDVPVTVPATQ